MIQIDMQMPENCSECRFATERGFCKAKPEDFCGYTDDTKRPDWCPLKEREAVEPTINEYGEIFCGNCGENVGIIGQTIKIVVRMKYCPECGMAVKNLTRLIMEKQEEKKHELQTGKFRNMQADY